MPVRPLASAPSCRSTSRRASRRPNTLARAGVATACARRSTRGRGTSARSSNARHGGGPQSATTARHLLRRCRNEPADHLAHVVPSLRVGRPGSVRLLHARRRAWRQVVPPIRWRRPLPARAVRPHEPHEEARKPPDFSSRAPDLAARIGLVPVGAAGLRIQRIGGAPGRQTATPNGKRGADGDVFSTAPCSPHEPRYGSKQKHWAMTILLARISEARRGDRAGAARDGRVHRRIRVLRGDRAAETSRGDRDAVRAQKGPCRGSKIGVLEGRLTNLGRDDDAGSTDD